MKSIKKQKGYNIVEFMVTVMGVFALGAMIAFVLILIKLGMWMFGA